MCYNEIVSGRGTASLPFRSIEACINYAIQKYALSSYSVTVHVKQGTYYTPNEILLSEFTHTTGSIYIVSEDGYGAATIQNSGSQNTIFEIEGGSWHFRGINFTLRTTTPEDDIPHHPACIVALYGSNVFINSCNFNATYVGDASTKVSVRGIAIDLNSRVYIEPDNLGPTTFHVDHGNCGDSCAIYLSQNSHAYFTGTDIPEQNNAYKVYFSGTTGAVFHADNYSTAGLWDGKTYHFTLQQYPGRALNGMQYRLYSSAHIKFGTNGVPGSQGYIETDTYCWYK